MACSSVLVFWKRGVGSEPGEEAGWDSHRHKLGNKHIQSFPSWWDLDKAAHPSGSQFPAHKMGTSVYWDYSYIPPFPVLGTECRSLYMLDRYTVPGSVMMLRTWKAGKPTLSTEFSGLTEPTVSVLPLSCMISDPSSSGCCDKEAVLCYFWDRTPYSPGLHQTPYITADDLELWFSHLYLPSAGMTGLCLHTLFFVCLFWVVLEVELRALSILNNSLTS